MYFTFSTFSSLFWCVAIIALAIAGCALAVFATRETGKGKARSVGRTIAYIAALLLLVTGCFVSAYVVVMQSTNTCQQMSAFWPEVEAKYGIEEDDVDYEARRTIAACMSHGIEGIEFDGLVGEISASAISSDKVKAAVVPEYGYSLKRLDDEEDGKYRYLFEVYAPSDEIQDDGVMYDRVNPSSDQ